MRTRPDYEQARRTDAIKFARSEALQKSLGNSEFIALDLSTFDENAESESFDFITTFDAIHDQAKPLNALKGVHRALKPEGVYLMQDISGTSHMDRDIEHPIGTFLYTISCMHCMTVSLAQGGEVLGAIGGKRRHATTCNEQVFDRLPQPDSRTTFRTIGMS